MGQVIDTGRNGVQYAMRTRADRNLSALGRALGNKRNRTAFTLIEVLVVVAIIALLIAILLPSLSRAREMAKSTLCLSHMKEFGLASSMYVMEHKDVLPGPQHPAMFTQVGQPPALAPLLQNQHLPRMLRKYFSDKSKQGSVVDELARCPSFPVADADFDTVIGGRPRPFHYCLNSWTYTDPQYYFGHINLSMTTIEEWKQQYAGRLDKFGPKRVSVIRRPDTEWMLADAFRKPKDYEVDFQPDAMRNGGHGSWPREDWAAGSLNSGESLPNSPFHLGRGHRREGSTYVYNGRVSTLYFDMHADSQRGFRGTVQPMR